MGLLSTETATAAHWVAQYYYETDTGYRFFCGKQKDKNNATSDAAITKAQEAVNGYFTKDSNGAYELAGPYGTVATDCSCDSSNRCIVYANILGESTNNYYTYNACGNASVSTNGTLFYRCDDDTNTCGACTKGSNITCKTNDGFTQFISGSSPSQYIAVPCAPKPTASPALVTEASNKIEAFKASALAIKQTACNYHTDARNICRDHGGTPHHRNGCTNLDMSKSDTNGIAACEAFETIRAKASDAREALSESDFIKEKDAADTIWENNEQSFDSNDYTSLNQSLVQAKNYTKSARNCMIRTYRLARSFVLEAKEQGASSPMTKRWQNLNDRIDNTYCTAGTEE